MKCKFLAAGRDCGLLVRKGSSSRAFAEQRPSPPPEAGKSRVRRRRAIGLGDAQSGREMATRLGQGSAWPRASRA